MIKIKAQESLAVQGPQVRPWISLVAPAHALTAYSDARGAELIPLEEGSPDTLAARLNTAAMRAQAPVLAFLPFGGHAAIHVLAELTRDIEGDEVRAGASCALISESGQAVGNGYGIIEDQLARIPILQAPLGYAAHGVTLASCIRPDLVVIKARPFWSVGGFPEGIAPALLGLGLSAGVRALHWRFAYRADLQATPAADSPSLDPRGAGVQALQELTRRFYGTFLPDGVRTPEGTMRSHPAVFGFPYLSVDGAFAETTDAYFEQEAPLGSCSVVVVTYNSMPTIGRCLESCLTNLGTFDELILVDNASRDGTGDYLAQFEGLDPRVKIIRNPKNLGFSEGCNVGIRASSGDCIVLLNPDTEVMPGWLARMRVPFADPAVGAVGPLSDYVAGFQKVALHVPQNTPQNLNYTQIAEFLGRENARMTYECRLLIGFCMMIRRSALEKVGLLDPELFLGMDDLDLSWRLRLAGYRLMLTLDVFVHHKGQVSFDSEPRPEVDALNQASADALARKLVAHYGKGNVPSSYELWGMNWFSPTFDCWAA